MSRLRLIVFLLLAGLSTLTPAQATFSVRGTLSDPTGAALSGTSVQVNDGHGRLLSQTVTNPRGEFLLTAIPRGSATLVVPPASGFAFKSVPLRMTADIANLRVSLTLASVSEQVTVAASQSLSTDASSNQDAVAVSADALRKLPVFDQDFVAALTPFLDPSATSIGEPTVIVDGVEMKASTVSPSVIQEVRVNNDPYSAEFNRPGRGRIEIITKPGSAHFHGEVNFLLRDAVFNAKNHFAPVRPPESRRIFEGHLTGPVGRGGHTSFISSGSLRQQDTAVAVAAVTPNGPVNENVLTPNRYNTAFLRLTHDFNPNHRVSVAYNYERNIRPNDGVGGLVLPEAGYNSDAREDDAVFNDRLILSPNLINQFQVLLEKDEDLTRSTTNAQSIQVPGSFAGGGAQADSDGTENTIHLSEVVSYTHGRHYVRAGVQLPQFSRRAVDDDTNRLGTYKFTSLATYGSGTPYVFTQEAGRGHAIYWINEFAMFFQDQIRLTQRVQLGVGMRYDAQSFLPDRNNFAPRVSLAYAPGKGATIFRTGVGVFNDRSGGTPYLTRLRDGVAIRNVQVQNPTYPVVSVNPLTYPTNLARLAPNLRTPYAFSYNGSAEHAFRGFGTVTVGYHGQVQVKSFRSRDVNAPMLPANPSLTMDYARPNAAFGQIQQIESTGRSLMNAFDLGYHGQAGRWFAGQAQYTLARAYNNTSGISLFPADQYHPNADWGRADWDALSRLNLLGNINPDHWLALGVALTLSSATPYTETTGNDDFHTGLDNARPAGVGRNTRGGAGIVDVDVVYNHDFVLTKAKAENAKVLSAGVSAFNVLNHTNDTSFIGALTSSLFGRPTASLPARQIQFSMGFRF